ncbi:hypothetical protein AZE42_14004 [Rhizopogon vesiculosus]|uniref:Uncharacterized protein n=1 Tax=Rhizopogon vesiculosus TaxID=180088 RepID=A0A1J8QSA7_9AGAM|nr:hypothetical protein AZE42_14004 [Rhizopogon vesiculosus]
MASEVLIGLILPRANQVVWEPVA